MQVLIVWWYPHKIATFVSVAVPPDMNISAMNMELATRLAEAASNYSLTTRERGQVVTRKNRALQLYENYHSGEAASAAKPAIQAFGLV